MPKVGRRFINVGIVAYPEVLNSCVYGLLDMFHIANQSADRQGCSSPVLRPTKFELDENGSVRSTLADAGRTENMHVIIVPPTLGPLPMGKDTSQIPTWLREQHARGTTLASVCGGAYLLAETGLLTGRTITTHWEHGEKIKKLHPLVNVDVDKLVIDEGDIITAGGMMAWIDLGLSLVDRYMGSDIMLATARFMVVDPGAREQRFYSGFNPRLDHGDTPIMELQHWLHGSDIKGLTLATMADRVNLSPRTFLRRFKSATGMNPSEYCQRYKMARSRELLGRPELTLEQVGRSCGYEDPKAYRQTFKKVFGLSPSEYRVRFGSKSVGDHN